MKSAGTFHGLLQIVYLCIVVSFSIIIVFLIVFYSFYSFYSIFIVIALSLF